MSVNRQRTQEKMDRHRAGAAAMWTDPDDTLPVCFAERAARFSQRPCLIYNDSHYSFADVDQASDVYAGIARNLGLAPGDVGAVMVENRPEFFYAWLGLVKIGVVAGLLNTAARGRALSHAIGRTGARVLFVGAECMDQLAQVEDLDPGLEIILIPDGDHTPEAADYPALAGHIRAIGSLADAAHPNVDFAALREGIDSRQTCFYVFTSGTTGLPKAALISHARWLSAGAGWNALCGFNENDVFYCALPLFHGAALMSLFSTAMLAGGATVLRRRFSVSRFWPDVQRHGVTVFQYVGEVCRYLINAPAVAEEKNHPLRVLMGSGIGREVWRRFHARFGAHIWILEGWGQTESNANLVNVDNLPGSCGRIPYFERSHMRLLKYDRANDELVTTPEGFYQACRAGEVGEICGQIQTGDGQIVSPFEGYTDPEETDKKILRDVFEPGDAWYRSGDLLRFDQDGYFYFVDRVGDTFRWKAENVSTAEVEQLLSAYDDAETINIYGVQVPGHEGRAPMAAIESKPGHRFDPRRFYRIATDLLPAYAVPLFVRILDRADITDTFKLRKVTLREQAFYPARIGDPLYVVDHDNAAYAPLQAHLVEKLGIAASTLNGDTAPARPARPCDDELQRQLLSGEAWDRFCDRLKSAGRHVLADDAPDDPIQVAEGYRYLSRLARMGLEMVLEYGDPSAPDVFYQNPTLKSGGDNPDNFYYWVRIRGAYEYRLDVALESNLALSLNVYAGSLNQPGGRRIVHECTAEDIQTDAHGRASLYLSTRAQPRNWLKMTDDTSTLLIRETVADRRQATPSRFAITRIDSDAPPEPLSPLRMARALRSVAGFVDYSVEYFMGIAADWRRDPNRFFATDQSLVGSSFGNTRIQYPSCYFSLRAHEALLIEFTPPGEGFWNVVVSNHWFESLDYENRHVHVNPWTASFAAGQPARIAVATRDPGWPGVHWLDSEAHLEGIVTVRFVDAPPQPVPDTQVLALDGPAPAIRG